MEKSTMFFYGIDMGTAIWCRTMEEAFYFFQIASYYRLKWQNDEPFRIDDYKRWNHMNCCYALRGSFGRTRDYDMLMTYTDFYKKMKPLLDAKGFKLIPFTQEEVNEEKVTKPETNLEHYATNLAKLMVDEVCQEALSEYGFPLEITTETSEENIMAWFSTIYKEPKKTLSVKEKGFVLYCGIIGFIARDESGELDWFNVEPQYEDGYWDVRKPCDNGYRFRCIDEDLFAFIKPGHMMSVHNIFNAYMKGEQI